MFKNLIIKNNNMSITQHFRNKLFKLKHNTEEFYSFESRTTNQTIEEPKKPVKNKKVSFNDVEIIDVESYKEYNKFELGLEFESIEKKNSHECNDCQCILV